jgi:hypothetical protein
VAVTPPGPIVARPRALPREMARTLPLPPETPVPPREMAKTLPLPPEIHPTTPGLTPGPTPPPPARDWTDYQTPPPAGLPGPATPKPAAVPAPRESAPSAPMWRPAESSRHLQPLNEGTAPPARLSTGRLPVFPIGLWRSVAVGVAAVLVIGALIVHVGVIPLEVLASWKKPAQLYVASEPEGGIAKLDGVRLIDPTPTKIPVSRDRQDHVIEIEYPGYRAVREAVRFDRSVALSFMFTLEKEGGAEIAPVAPVRPPLGALPSGGDQPGR